MDDDGFIREVMAKKKKKKLPRKRKRPQPLVKKRRKRGAADDGESKILDEIMRDPDFSSVHEQIKAQIEEKNHLLKKIKGTGGKMDGLSPAMAELQEAVNELKELPPEVYAKVKGNLTKVVAAVKRADKKIQEYGAAVSSGLADLQDVDAKLFSLAADRKTMESAALQRRVKESDLLDSKGRPYVIPKTIHYAQLKISLQNDKGGIWELAKNSLFDL